MLTLDVKSGFKGFFLFYSILRTVCLYICQFFYDERTEIFNVYIMWMYRKITSVCTPKGWSICQLISEFLEQFQNISQVDLPQKKLCII